MYNKKLCSTLKNNYNCCIHHIHDIVKIEGFLIILHVLFKMCFLYLKWRDGSNKWTIRIHPPSNESLRPRISKPRTWRRLYHAIRSWWDILWHSAREVQKWRERIIFRLDKSGRCKFEMYFFIFENICNISVQTREVIFFAKCVPSGLLSCVTDDADFLLLKCEHYLTATVFFYVSISMQNYYPETKCYIV